MASGISPSINNILIYLTEESWVRSHDVQNKIKFLFVIFDSGQKKKNQFYLKGFGVGWESEAEGGASHEPAQWL